VEKTSKEQPSLLKASKRDETQAEAYRTFIVEQELLSMQQSQQSRMFNSPPPPEDPLKRQKITMKNNMKAFKEDSQIVEGIANESLDVSALHSFKSFEQ